MSQAIWKCLAQIHHRSSIIAYYFQLSTWQLWLSTSSACHVDRGSRGSPASWAPVACDTLGKRSTSIRKRMDKPTTAQCIQRWHLQCSSVVNSAHVSRFHLHRLFTVSQSKEEENGERGKPNCVKNRGRGWDSETWWNITNSCILHGLFFKGDLNVFTFFCKTFRWNERTYFSTDSPQMHGNFATLRPLKFEQLDTLNWPEPVSTQMFLHLRTFINLHGPATCLSTCRPVQVSPSRRCVNVPRGSWRYREIPRRSSPDLAGPTKNAWSLPPPLDSWPRNRPTNLKTRKLNRLLFKMQNNDLPEPASIQQLGQTWSQRVEWSSVLFELCFWSFVPNWGKQPPRISRIWLGGGCMGLGLFNSGNRKS